MTTYPRSRRPSPQRPWLLVPWLGAWWLGACGGAVSGVDLAVVTLPLEEATQKILFTVQGDALGHEAIGGHGAIDENRRGRIRFARVPEGYKFVAAFGFASGSTDGDDPVPGTPPVYYWLAENGLGEVEVISRQQNAVQLVMLPRPQNARVGVDQYLRNGWYDFDASSACAGSPDCSNVAVAVVDGLDLATCPDVTVYVSAETPETSPVGIFAALPEGSQANQWTDPAQTPWAASLSLSTMAGNADPSKGDVVFFIVAKPGTSGRDVFLPLAAGPSSPSCSLSGETSPPTFLVVRIAGMGGLSGDVP